MKYTVTIEEAETVKDQIKKLEYHFGEINKIMIGMGATPLVVKVEKDESVQE